MKQSDGKLSQNIALGVLLFVGVLTIGLGFYRVRYQIALPFKAQITRAESEKNAPVSLDAEIDPELLKSQDTDGDGLSDYDESNTYHTSPYLKDTDSDSYDDKTELDSGNDPNCPKGKVCFTASQSTGIPATSQSSTSNDRLTALQADLDKLAKLTPDQIRELLKAQGFSEEELKQYDDATLKETYQESLQQALKIEQEKARQQSPSAKTPDQVPPAAPAQVNIKDFANISKDQIIQLLGETGELNQEQLTQLKALDEASLRKVFLDSLEKAQQNLDTNQKQ